jgi:hypothetical protein
MAGIRSSAEETERRVFQIQGWIIGGVPDYLIIKNIEQQFINADGKGLSRRQAKVLLQKAYTIWQQEEEATIDQKRALRIAELKQDVRNMKDEYKGTPKGMSVINSIKKEISKLEALYPARTHILKGDKDNPLIPMVEGFTPDKEKRLAELLEKAQKAMNQ